MDTLHIKLLLISLAVIPMALYVYVLQRRYDSKHHETENIHVLLGISGKISIYQHPAISAENRHGLMWFKDANGEIYARCIHMGQPELIEEKAHMIAHDLFYKLALVNSHPFMIEIHGAVPSHHYPRVEQESFSLELASK